MEIYTIIVTYNSMHWAEKCFGSLQTSFAPTKVVAVDNGSTDGTVPFIKTHYPDVHVIETGENLGFAKANNIGIRYALDKRAEYVFLLNHDAWVEKETIGTLVQMMNNGERIGIVSPIHLTGDYSAIDSEFVLYMPHAFNVDKNHGALKDTYELYSVNAAAWMMNAKMIREVGGFDTILFKHYGEDDNYCQRVHYFKWMIALCTTTTICHDRQKRVSSEINYREGVLGQKLYAIEAKARMGDINRDVNIDYYILREFILMIGWGCLLKFDRAKRHKELCDAYKSVKISRRINCKGGLLYL